ncbi:MAG: efflux RND transporter permease subunit, partial [Cyanobacteria bacterium REEB65]|nr:efflux RND transporter permease subunit [Cyanobacteria bacterium REEB65]
YVVQGNGQDLGTLRSIQDFYIRYALAAVPGVAEVASGGGFQREYQVEADPERLRAYGLSVGDVAKAISASNREVGGGIVERSGSEYAIRGRGYLHGEDDIRQIVLKEDNGVPVRLGAVATVQMGGQPRRGVLDLNGRGEAVVGVVVMRQGENAKAVIDRVKAKIAQIAPGLPRGVRIVPFYDRSELIMAAVHTLEHTLIEEGIIVSLVILLFLRHWPSALAVILSIPMAVLGSFILMERLGISSNIMSLGGVAIAIGVLVDAAIVMVENAHRHLSEAHHAHVEPHMRAEHVARAAKQVGRPIVFSLIIILVAFVPVFFLTGAEGKLFRPLAFTKSFAMGSGALLAVTLVPVLMTLLLRGRLERESDNPVAQFFQRLYRPVLNLALKYRWPTVGIALVATLATIPVALSLGSEFMPPLDEGSLLFMP